MAAVENNGTRMCPQATHAMEKGKETNQWVSVPMVASIQSTLTTLCIIRQDGIGLFLIEKTFPVSTDAYICIYIQRNCSSQYNDHMVCIGKAEC